MAAPLAAFRQEEKDAEVLQLLMSQGHIKFPGLTLLAQLNHEWQVMVKKCVDTASFGIPDIRDAVEGLLQEWNKVCTHSTAASHEADQLLGFAALHSAATQTQHTHIHAQLALRPAVALIARLPLHDVCWWCTDCRTHAGGWDMSSIR
jgi:hypothetical protein